MTMYNGEKLLEFRRQKDWHWKNDTESPLTNEQKKKFTGLKYFPPNPAFHFVLKINKNIDGAGSKVIVPTTDGNKQVYLKAGIIRFKVGEKDVEAIVFEDPEQEQYQYYLLFRDETTGKETYENGRMLQVEREENKLIVDFNYAYNPYSSYNDNWGCPITPKENLLPVVIKAGEKKFL
ncbi:MAG: DUF1684 domain-containing protein [Candidatus Curtissbacteria bacterium]